MVQTRSKKSALAPLPPMICKKQQKIQREENSLQLEDINSIPDPPTPPNPSTLQKSVAVAVANAKRRRVSAAARRLSNGKTGSSTLLLQQHRGIEAPFTATLGYGSDSNYVSREASFDIINNRGDRDRENTVIADVVDADCSNDSDMSIDVSIDQPPQLQLLQPQLVQERNPKGDIRRSSIFYDDSSHDQEEDKDNNNKIRRRRQSMFKKKDLESNDYFCLGGNELVDDEEEINSSHDVVSKRWKGSGRGRRSLLLPSDEGNRICENRKSGNESRSSQNLIDNGAPLSQKSGNIWGENCVPPLSTNIITASNAVTSIATTNIVDDQPSQLPQPLLALQERNPVGNIRRSSICFDDSGHDQEEDINKIKKRRRQSMFQKKDQESNDYISLENKIIAGREEEEQANLMTKFNNKRNRRSLLLPGEVVDYEEEIDSSHDVVSKRRRSLLLPSDEGNAFSWEIRESENESGSSQNLIDNGAPSSEKRGNIREEKCVSSSSTNIITGSNAVTSIATANIIFDEQPKENRSSLSTTNAINPYAGKVKEEQHQGQQRIKSRKFPPVHKDELNQMKIAIRKFCSIPLQERYKSEDAGILHINAIGYPITSAIDKLKHQQEIKDFTKRNDGASATSSLNLDWTSIPKNSNSTQNKMDTSDRDGIAARAQGSGEEIFVTKEMKRSILMKMCPVVQVIEARRKEEEAFVEACTGCLVERKRGKFKYISLSTGKKVSSFKYQQLYLEMSRKRRLEIQEDRREKVEVAPHLAEVLQQKMHSNSCTTLENMEPNEPVREWNGSIENKDITSPIGLCNEANEKDSEEPQCVPEEEVDSPMPGVGCPTNTTPHEETSKGIEQLNKGYSRDDEASLSISEDVPLRENLSPNHEMAALQTTLFSAIDVALQTYSDDVLRLRERQSREQHTLMDT